MSPSRQITVARLREMGITPDTRLGQHFLVDDNLVRVAIRLADLVPQDTVLEVGPGLGVLTAALAPAVAHVHTIEIDRRLELALATTLSGIENVSVVFADALRFDLSTLDPPPTAFVANLPYNIATPLIAESIGDLPTVERWSVMIQREAADRLFAAPRTTAYGGVSVLLGLACVRTGQHRVSRAVFAPSPNVDSVLVGFHRSPGWPALAPRWPAISALVHAAFSHRRKTAANALALSGLHTRAEAEAGLAALGFDGNVRAEAIEPDAFAALEAILPQVAERVEGP